MRWYWYFELVSSRLILFLLCLDFSSLSLLFVFFSFISSGLKEPLLGERVFKNAAGFILMPPVKGESARMFDPLAVTRIHPESYPLVDKLLEDASGTSGLSSSSSSSSSRNGGLEKRKQKWDRIRSMMNTVSHDGSASNPLRSISMIAYAESIAAAAKDRDDRLRAEMGGGEEGGEAEGEELVRLQMYRSRQYDKSKTLQHIVEEMHAPGSLELERLTEWIKYSGEEMFQLVTGLRSNFYKKNPIMACTVISKKKNDANTTNIVVKLDCGQVSFMSDRDFDTGGIDEIVDGQVFYGMCTNVIHDDVKIFMSAKEQDLEEWNTKEHPSEPTEFYFYQVKKDDGKVEDHQQHQQQQRTRRPRPLNKRTIYEECFHNVSREGALELLSKEDVGIVVFRPSSKNYERLNATLKFFENTYSDYIIVEEDKDKETPDTMKNLGGKLYVGERQNQADAKGDEFTSLEELQFTYFNELMENAETVTHHRKYMKGGRSIVETQCYDEINTKPASCAYHFCVSHAHPGFFELGYITTKTYRYMYIQPEVNGLRCAGKLFSSLTELMKEFKKGPHKLFQTAQRVKQAHQQRLEEHRRNEAASAALEAAAELEQAQSQQMHYNSGFSNAPPPYGGGGYGGYAYPPPQQHQPPPQYNYTAPQAYGGGYQQPQQPPPQYNNYPPPQAPTNHQFYSAPGPGY